MKRTQWITTCLTASFIVAGLTLSGWTQECQLDQGEKCEIQKQYDPGEKAPQWKKSKNYCPECGQAMRGKKRGSRSSDGHLAQRGERRSHAGFRGSMEQGPRGPQGDRPQGRRGFQQRKGAMAPPYAGAQFGPRGPRFGQRGPDFEQRGPRRGRGGPDIAQRGPQNGRRGPGYGQQGPRDFQRGPQFRGQGPDSAERGPRFGQRGQRFNRQGPGFDRPGVLPEFPAQSRGQMRGLAQDRFQQGPPEHIREFMRDMMQSDNPEDRELIEKLRDRMGKRFSREDGPRLGQERPESDERPAPRMEERGPRGPRGPMREEMRGRGPWGRGFHGEGPEAPAVDGQIDRINGQLEAMEDRLLELKERRERLFSQEN